MRTFFRVDIYSWTSCFKRWKKLDVQVKVGYYGNVNIGVIRTNGDMVTILPMNIQKIWKVNIIDERKK